MLNIESQFSENKYIVYLTGRLDTNTSKDLEAELNNLTDKTGDIQISFKELEYISSAGLRVILAFYKKFKSLNKGYILSDMKPLVKEVFDISGFSKFLEIK